MSNPKNKLTKEKFNQQLLDGNYNFTLLGDYTNAHVATTFKCLLCGNENFVCKPYCIKNGNTKSCGCKTREFMSESFKIHRMSQEEAQAKIDQYNLKIVDYKGYDPTYITEPSTIQCFCGKLFEIIPKNITEHTSCGCKYKHAEYGGWSTKYTVESVRDDLKERGFTLLSTEYTSCDKHIDVTCHCGRNFTTTYYAIKSGNTISCGCSRMGSENDYKIIKGSFMSSIWSRAKVYNREATIVAKDVYDQLVSQDFTCALTGYKFNPDGDSLISVDRINCKRGYTIDNIRIVQFHANIMRLDMDDSELLSWCQLVVNNIPQPLSLRDTSRDTPNDHGLFKGIHNFYTNHWKSHARTEYRHNSHDIKVMMTMEDAWNIFEKQNRRCALTGLHIYMGRSGERTASLDRIDSFKDYTIDNCQWVHKTINRSKWHLTHSRYLEMCKMIVNHLSQ
jgi:hypothetical protein